MTWRCITEKTCSTVSKDSLPHPLQSRGSRGQDCNLQRMADDVPEWQMMWGAKVKMPNDMPDDLLRDSISVTNAAIQAFPDFDADGE